MIDCKQNHAVLIFGLDPQLVERCSVELLDEILMDNAELRNHLNQLEELKPYALILGVNKFKAFFCDNYFSHITNVTN